MAWDYLADRANEVPTGRNGVLLAGREMLLDTYVQGQTVEMLLECDEATAEASFAKELAIRLDHAGLI